MAAKTLTINGKLVSADETSTILEAATEAGIEIPTLCHLEGLPPSGACRMCVVEMEGTGSFVTACSYPVAAGMKIQTRSPKVLDARRTIVELLLSNHPDDCLYCARSGKCDLQTLSQSMGIRQRMSRSAGLSMKKMWPGRSFAIRINASSAAAACGSARRSRESAP